MKDIEDYVNTVDSEDDDPEDWITCSSGSSNFTQAKPCDADDKNTEMEDVAMPHPVGGKRSILVKDWISSLSTIVESSEMDNP